MAWLSGLILLCSSQFVHLTALARTDMMLCLFITLAIYFFLLAHQDEGRKARYPFLMWSALGLGTLTKGPVALLGLLVVLAFLACRRELGFVKRLRVGWGALLWLGIALAWFLPALAVGGREFYRIVVLNEMAHRVLASGSRVGKGKPVYYLVGHFVSGFLPWCLLVPPALAAFWRSRRDASGRPMLLPVVWLLTVLV
ncbi:MAG: glycosyltransferase family 39 protein, partial [Candidatus Brocadiae bacterium]|nr:glycosyltransferase family 39 protein [Candidatus Brocadiia bacterium]